MRRRRRNRGLPNLLLFAVSVWTALAMTGPLQSQSLFGKNKDEKKKSPPKSVKSLPSRALITAEYESVGDGAVIDGLLPIKVEGVGLVIHLPGTGNDPPPDRYRDMLMEDMKKMEIYKPKELLASNTTALVLLRAFIPPGCRKGDAIDVEVYVPNGYTTTSLKGGWLLEATLKESMVGKSKSGASKALPGKAWLKVAGPVLVAENSSDKTDVAALKKGKVLGGGRILAERDFKIIYPKDISSGRRIKAVTYRINQRFFDSNDGLRTGLAVAKDDRMIELKMDRRYKYDIARYINVVRRLPMSSSETFQQRLLEELRNQLTRPATALDAGLKMEAIGKPAAPALREGLASKSEIVRFASAVGLAYLGDPAGIPELGRLAEASPEYRSHAMSALVIVDHTLARMQLARLLNAAGAETRYGAFRSLWTYDAKDQLVAGESVNGQFFLHGVPSKGEPMVHLASNFRPEVVLFDPKQPLQTPVTIRTDNFGGDSTSKRQGTSLLLQAGAHDDRIQMVRFLPAAPGSRENTMEQRVSCENRLIDIVRQAGKMGATYPEIVDLLKQAEKNGNLSGRLAVNALPRSLTLDALQTAALAGEEGAKLKSEGVTPGLFAPIEQGGRTGALADSDDDDAKDKDGKKTPAKKPGFWSRFLGN